MTHYDVIIIGAGHNSLTAGAYLARAGMRVHIVEQRDRIGGVATTAPLFGRYPADLVHHEAGLLRRRIIDDLALTQYGLTLIHPDPVIFAPLPDGRHLALWRDAQRTANTIGRIAPQDAAAYPAYHAAVTGWAAQLNTLLAQPATLAGFTADANLRLMRQCVMSLEQFLSQWFTHPAVMGLLAAPGLLGVRQGPLSGGTAYNLLYHHLGQHESGVPSTAHVKGGIGRIAHALHQAASAAGATLQLNSRVTRVRVERGRTTGVQLADGTTLNAPIVVSGADPATTMRGLVDPLDLPPRYKQAIRHIKFRGAVARLHLLLDGVPAFTALPDAGATHLLQGRIQIAPTLLYAERAYDAAKYGRFSAEPVLDIRIPTLTDPDRAPDGRQIMSIWAQYAPFDLRGSDWPAQRHLLTTTIIDTIARYAPTIRNHIVDAHLITPDQLSTDFSLTDGAIYHGEQMLDQILTMRPVPGYGDHTTPVEGVYLCGSGAHPGGGVTGEPGRLAAARVLEDLF